MYHYCANVDGKIYAVAGHTRIENTYLNLASVEIYDVVTNEWSEGPPLPSPSSQGAMVAVASKLIVMGGVTEESSRPIPTLFELLGKQTFAA